MVAVGCLALAGSCLLGVAALLFWLLMKHLRVGVRHLDPDEAARLAFARSFPDTSSSSDLVSREAVLTTGGAGVEVELSFGIDDLREAFRANDRKTFWLWPTSMSSFILGLGSLLAALLLLLSVPWVIQGIVALFSLLMLLVIWFMQWAAVYTKIDVGTAKIRRGR